MNPNTTSPHAATVHGWTANRDHRLERIDPARPVGNIEPAPASRHGRVADLGPPHPWPWLQDGDHRRAFALLVALDDTRTITERITLAQQYRDRWSDADLLAALHYAEHVGGLPSPLQHVRTGLLRRELLA